MSAEKLYGILSESTDSSIPWHKAAEHFLALKLASGGLLPAEVEKLEKAAKSPKKKEGEIEKQTCDKTAGFMDLARQAAKGLGTFVGTHPKFSKYLGSAAIGAGTGAIAAGPENRLSGAVKGGLVGAAIPGVAAGVRKWAPPLLGLDKAAMVRVIREFEKLAKGESIEQARTEEQEAAVPVSEQPMRDEVGAAHEAEPVPQIPQDLQPNPMNEILELIQKANESDFHKQRADQAAATAEQAAEQSKMLEEQVNQLSQQQQAMMQQQAATEQEHAQQAQVITQQTQASQQEAMTARDEALQAQQQALALRQSITSYRQQLMDMLSQDPTMVAGPPVAPTGPLATSPANASVAPPQDQGQAGAAPQDMAAAQGAAPGQQMPAEQPPQQPSGPPPMQVNIQPPKQPAKPKSESSSQPAQ